MKLELLSVVFYEPSVGPLGKDGLFFGSSFEVERDT